MLQRVNKNGPVNQAPQCLYLDADTKKKKKDEIVIVVTMHFNEQLVAHPLGEILVALTGGDLYLDLDGMKFIRHIKFGNLPNRIVRKSNITSGSADKGSMEYAHKTGLSGDIAVANSKFGMSANSELKRTIASEKSAAVQNESTYEVFQVNAINGERPGWRIRLQTSGVYLEGSIVDEAFGECKVLSRPCRARMTFIVEPRFIRMDIIGGVLLGKGLYPLQNPAKHKIFNLLLWKKIIRPLFNPFLSQVEICYE